MRNVLADLAVESEAALVLSLRVARAIDASARDESAAALARIATAVGKYWVCKRAPGHIFESMEWHGGPGYIEDSIMPRLYREAPVNSIWEGSGNVICLDVLRAMFREQEAIPALLDELYTARGVDPNLDRAVNVLKKELNDPADMELRARMVTELMAVTLTASVLVRYAPSAIADAFCASRLGSPGGGSYGTLPPTSDFDAIIELSTPAG